MIRQLAILAVAAICLTAQATAKITLEEKDEKAGYKLLSELLAKKFYLEQAEPDLLEIGRNLDIEKLISTYDEKYQGIVKKFYDYYKITALPRGQLYTPHHPKMQHETALLFNVFYQAPNIWSLIYLSSWAYLHVNEYIFSFVLQSALIHRTDTSTMPIPHPYQIIPEFFFNTDVMRQIADYKVSLLTGGEVKPYTHTVVANYTGWYTIDSFDPEYKLAYFREDIGLNSWFYRMNLKYAEFLSRAQYPDVKISNLGEVFFNMYKFIASRYNLERFSAGLGPIEYLDFTKPIVTGYSPYMTFPNGMHFPQRREWSMVPVWLHKYLNMLINYETRIDAAVDSGFYLSKEGKLESLSEPEGINILGNLIQGNYESVNRDYYGDFDSFAKRVVGYGPILYNHEQIIPSALELYSTALRDPGFYRIADKIYNWFTRLQAHKKLRTPDELICKGVRIDSVLLENEKLYTFYEKYDTLVDKFSWSKNENVAEIKARQYRLNHDIFTLKMVINSLEKMKVSVRIFVGPEFSTHGVKLTEVWKHFYEIDFFVTELKEGRNTLERKSTEAPWSAPEYETTAPFMGPLEGEEKIQFMRKRFGFPGRLILPKGTSEGLPVQFFIYVSEFASSESEIIDTAMLNRDDKALGYPMDRPLYNFTLDNMYLMPTKIYFRDEDMINLTTV